MVPTVSRGCGGGKRPCPADPCRQPPDAVGAVREGGPHGLKRGEWTDDTAMALALADSLVADARLDAVDLMRRFLRHRA